MSEVTDPSGCGVNWPVMKNRPRCAIRSKPEESIIVLAYGMRGVFGPRWNEAAFTHGRFTTLDYMKLTDVTHWMEMPEVPK